MRISLSQLYGSSVASSLICQAVCQTSMTRVLLCRDLLILQQLYLHLGDRVSFCVNVAFVSHSVLNMTNNLYVQTAPLIFCILRTFLMPHRPVQKDFLFMHPYTSSCVTVYVKGDAMMFITNFKDAAVSCSISFLDYILKSDHTLLRLLLRSDSYCAPTRSLTDWLIRACCPGFRDYITDMAVQFLQYVGVLTCKQ